MHNASTALCNHPTQHHLQPTPCTTTPYARLLISRPPAPAEPRPRNPHHQPVPAASFLPTRGTAAPCPGCARLLISPRRSLTYTLQRPSSALHSPPYPGVNQKLTHPRNPCRLHPLHLRALTFTLHHTPQHQGRAPPERNVVSSSHPPSNTPPPAEPAPPTRAGCHLILLRTLQSPHNTSSPLPLLFSYPEVNHHPPCTLAAVLPAAARIVVSSSHPLP